MKRILLAAALVWGSAARMQADVIFSTLDGPQVGGYQVVGATASQYFPTESVAASFTLSSAFLLTGAGVQVEAISGATFNMTLFATDVNGLPGTELTTLGTGLIAPATSEEVSAVSAVTLTLAAETQYWLVLTPAADDTQVSWGVLNGAPNSPLSTTVQTDGSGGWSIVGYEPVEFEIDGTRQTPEGGTVWLWVVGLGLVVGGAVRGGRRSTFHRSDLGAK